MAFAGPDYEEDFNQMKDTAIDQELGIDEKRNKILVDGTIDCFLSLGRMLHIGTNIDTYHFHLLILCIINSQGWVG